MEQYQQQQQLRTGLLLEDYVDTRSAATSYDENVDLRSHLRPRILSQVEADLASQLSEERVKNRKPFPFAFVAFGLLLVVIGYFAPSRLDVAVDDAVWEAMRLDSEQARGFQAFAEGQNVKVDADDSIYLRFRVYDIVNSRQLIHGGENERYKLVEKGPYVYKMRIRHLNISYFGEDTGEFDRNHLKEMYFKTWQSAQLVLGGPDGGKDDSEVITQFSMTYQIVQAVAKSFLPNHLMHDLVLKFFLGDSLRERQQRMFTTRTVREHLFGYHETFDRGNSVKFDDASNSVAFNQVLNSIKKKLRFFPKAKLGDVYLSDNGGGIGFDYPGFVQNFSSADAVDAKMAFDAYRVDRNMMHTFFWYQGSNQLRRCNHDTCPPLWGSREANRVLGSDGKFWGGKSHSENVIFLSALERSARLVKDNSSASRKVEVDGIHCDRYRLHPSIFSNTTFYPENSAYYGTNQPVGVLNLSPVLFDVPIYASKPRFLHGDLDELLKCCEGIPEAVENEHDTTFDVHKETGISVLVSERFQYTIRTPGKKGDDWFVPIFWFETIELMSNRHEKLFKKCDTYVFAASWFKYFGFFFGISSIVIGASIGIDRAERDAKMMQVKSIYEHLFTNPERDENESDNDDDDERRVVQRNNRNQETPKHGLQLLLSTKSIRDAWFTIIPFVFFMNSIIELVTLQKSKKVGVWTSYASGEMSAAKQLVLTAFLVGIFMTVNGVAVTRAAFIRGEIPRQKIIFRPIQRRRCYVLPWLFTDHPCYLGVTVGISFVIFWAGFVLLLAFIFLCGAPTSQDACTLNWVIFVLFKGSFAALEASIAFPLACLKTLNDASYREQFSRIRPHLDEDNRA